MKGTKLGQKAEEKYKELQQMQYSQSYGWVSSIGGLFYAADGLPSMVGDESFHFEEPLN